MVWFSFGFCYCGLFGHGFLFVDLFLFFTIVIIST